MVGVDERRGRRQEVAPECVHGRAVDAAGAVEQPDGIIEVRRAEVMHMHTRPLLRPPAGRAGVVQVDVRYQNVPDVGRGQAVNCQVIQQGR